MDITKFKELRKQKLTNQEIAEYFNVSLSTLKRFIKDNNLSRNKDKFTNLIAPFIHPDCKYKLHMTTENPVNSEKLHNMDNSELNPLEIEENA